MCAAAVALGGLMFGVGATPASRKVEAGVCTACGSPMPSLTSPEWNHWVKRRYTWWSPRKWWLCGSCAKR